MSQSSAFMSHRLNQDHFVMVDLSAAYIYRLWGKPPHLQRGICHRIMYEYIILHDCITSVCFYCMSYCPFC